MDLSIRAGIADTAPIQTADLPGTSLCLLNLDRTSHTSRNQSIRNGILDEGKGILETVVVLLYHACT